MTIQTKSREVAGLLAAVIVACLVSFAAPVVAEGPNSLKAIRRVDLVHMTHTDVGFTDHPIVCRQQQMRYFDIAIDAVLATCSAPPEAQFCWTAETTLAVGDWWQAADAKRRADLLRALDTGRLEIGAMVMNQTPTLNAAEWRTIINWLPAGLRQHCKPRVAIQNDVNGFPRAGAMVLLDHGVDGLLMGINSTSGGAPMKRPSAFWWKMPDGRRMFVWLGDHYAQGFYYFHASSWRRGPVPESTDTRYRPARPGDFFRADEAAVRAAHTHLIDRLRGMEASGYDYPSLIVSVTNEWRMDNDPPFPPLADFVATWHRLGLQPELHMTTVADAMARMRREVGAQLPVYTGEWTDWWANGVASGPREVAASRRAKRLTAAATSPVWGEPDQPTRKAADAIYRDLCLFDEHTWGSSESVANPHSLDTWAQYNEKSRMAYRPMALAKLLLAQRARSAVYPRPEGLYVANTAAGQWSGWITMPSSCLRGNFQSLVDVKTGSTVPLVRDFGPRPFTRPTSTNELTVTNTSETYPDHCPDQQVRFWIEGLAGHTISRFRFSEQTVALPKLEQTGFKAMLSAHGWPTTAIWPGMKKPLFEAGTGDFLSVGIPGFAGRWAAMDIFSTSDPVEREKRRAVLEEIPAQENEAATVSRNSHTTIYSQTLAHPRLKWFTRRLELWNDAPRARLTIRFHRLESERPELFFVAFNLPCGTTLPETSNGGLSFVPYTDQLPGTCRDYFSIDDWVRYQTPVGNWLWVTRDAPLVTFGEHQVLAHRTTPCAHPNRILAMVLNNVWFTNFVADSHGAFEFQFDIAWQSPDKSPTDPSVAAATMLAEPQIVINPELRESPIFMRRLHRP